MPTQLSTLSFRVAVRHLLMVPLVVLLLMGGIVGLSIDRLVISARWVDHTDQVLGATYRLQNLILDEEMGLRGFLLTGDASTRSPFDSTHLPIERQFNILSELVMDNLAQERKLSEIHRQYGSCLEKAQKDVAQQVTISLALPLQRAWPLLVLCPLCHL